jgi:hypothetical protein
MLYEHSRWEHVEVAVRHGLLPGTQATEEKVQCDRRQWTEHVTHPRLSTFTRNVA